MHVTLHGWPVHPTGPRQAALSCWQKSGAQHAGGVVIIYHKQQLYLLGELRLSPASCMLAASVNRILEFQCCSSDKTSHLLQALTLCLADMCRDQRTATR